MADDAARKPGPFNVETIRELVRLMARHDLAEILLEQGDGRIRLRRALPGLPPAAVPHAVPAAVPLPVPTQPAATPAATEAQPTAPAKTLREIKSPMVGTFYRAEKPDAEPYVKVGSKVTPTTTVCMIEAMKLYNEIQADCAGTIVEVCVENAQPVEFNTVLFRVDTSG